MKMRALLGISRRGDGIAKQGRARFHVLPDSMDALATGRVPENGDLSVPTNLLTSREPACCYDFNAGYCMKADGAVAQAGGSRAAAISSALA